LFSLSLPCALAFAGPRSFVCLFACCGIRGNYYILITHALAAQLQRCRRRGRANSREWPKKYNRKNVNENGVKNQFHGFYIPVYLL